MLCACVVVLFFEAGAVWYVFKYRNIQPINYESVNAAPTKQMIFIIISSIHCDIVNKTVNALMVCYHDGDDLPV